VLVYSGEDAENDGNGERQDYAEGETEWETAGRGGAGSRRERPNRAHRESLPVVRLFQRSCHLVSRLTR
jgi:hypothetical protein